ncbi:unnamed protein product [Chrysoparadoxa australica]
MRVGAMSFLPRLLCKRPLSSLRPEALSVLYIDHHVLAINKPPGVLSQNDVKGSSSPVSKLAEVYLREKLGKAPFIRTVHRLDRPVSGVICLALSHKAATSMSQSFKTRQGVHKCYYCVVEGSMDGGGCVESMVVAPGKKARTQVICSRTRPGSWFEGKEQESEWITESGVTRKGAKLAVLDWAAVHSFTHRLGGKQTLLRVRIHTGRKHQIRCQLSALGHPVVGDTKYGSKVRLKDRSIALHARTLVLPHPVSGKPLILDAPVPATWCKLFDDELVKAISEDGQTELGRLQKDGPSQVAQQEQEQLRAVITR